MALEVGTDIRDQKLPYMFETVDAQGNPLEQYILPINPESYDLSHSTRTNVTQTLGGAFEDNTGLGLPRISMQGTFGYLGTLVGGHGRSLSSIPKDGWELFIELEGIFLDFYDRFGTYDQGGKKNDNPVLPGSAPELRFYNYTDQDYFLVQLNRFGLKKSTNRKFLYSYDIQLTVLRRLDEPTISEDDLAAYLQEIPALDADGVSLWGQILAGYAWAYNGMSEVINQVQSLQNDLATISSSITAFRQGISDFIEAPFGLISSAIGTIDTVLTTVISLGDIPHEFVDLLRRTKRDLLNLSLKKALFSTNPAATGTVATDSSNAAAVIEILTAPLPTGDQSVAGSNIVAMDIPETTLFDPSMAIVQEVSARTESVSRNDTIETIAQRTLGSASAWRRLVLLNDLEYPFIVQRPLDQYSPVLQSGVLTYPVNAGDRIVYLMGIAPVVGNILLFDGSEPAVVEQLAGAAICLEAPLSANYAAGMVVTRHERILSVLLAGSKMLIPGANTIAAPITGGSDTELATRIYGTDEQLDDVGAQSADGQGDIATKSGVANLEMQLQHRLKTVRGELVRHPDYGSYLPKIIGKTGIDFWYERAKVEAKITILQDPRVRKVGAVNFTVDGTAVLISADTYLNNETSPTRLNLLVA